MTLKTLSPNGPHKFFILKAEWNIIKTAEASMKSPPTSLFSTANMRVPPNKNREIDVKARNACFVALKTLMTFMHGVVNKFIPLQTILAF